MICVFIRMIIIRATSRNLIIIYMLRHPFCLFNYTILLELTQSWHLLLLSLFYRVVILIFYRSHDFISSIIWFVIRIYRLNIRKHQIIFWVDLRFSLLFKFSYRIIPSFLQFLNSVLNWQLFHILEFIWQFPVFQAFILK